MPTPLMKTLTLGNTTYEICDVTARGGSGGGSASYVTPELFGAVGNGVTDDTAAIQDAFDAAANGGTVLFGRGKSYVVSKHGETYVAGGTAPETEGYMLKISGSMTILGNGATIKRTTISQNDYDNKTDFCPMLFFDNAERSSSNNSAQVNDRNYVTIRDLTLDGGMSSSIARGSNAGGEAKAIFVNDTRGTFLELDSCTIKEFPAEGVYGRTYGGVAIARGCTFTNCSPSAWNVAGRVAECIGCTFNQTEEYCHASEFTADMGVFDSCVININNGWVGLSAGLNSNPMTVRNCTFNISSYMQQHEYPIIRDDHEDVFIDSCIFNDARSNNVDEVILRIPNGKIHNCTFNRDSMSADEWLRTLKAKDGIANIVNIGSISGGDITGRGLEIRLTNSADYRIRKITPPKAITIIPTVDCTFNGYGADSGYGGTGNFVTLDKELYANFPYKIFVDYEALGELTYSDYYDTVATFRVKCSGKFDLIIET